MADINVQPKRKSSWWFWLVLIFIAAGLLYFLLNKDGRESTDRMRTIPATSNP
ncbi:hypothetical protein [Pedobacter antarcticus]|uniref:hypothetical protein n=1 Tax=Pedobacter antarcticus TaxID=34086 RepID=UPI0012FA4D2B|nr:hypothetical protein [Pedobacter antarcticus]